MAKVPTGEIEIIPERRVEKTKTICDMCGLERGTDKGVYEDVEVRAALGVVMSPGSYNEETDIDDYFDFDICGACFKNKLVPFILSQHAQTSTSPR